MIRIEDFETDRSREVAVGFLPSNNVPWSGVDFVDPRITYAVLDHVTDVFETSPDRGDVVIEDWLRFWAPIRALLDLYGVKPGWRPSANIPQIDIPEIACSRKRFRSNKS